MGLIARYADLPSASAASRWFSGQLMAWADMSRRPIRDRRQNKSLIEFNF
jgi:hypothetical protein